MAACSLLLAGAAVVGMRLASPQPAQPAPADQPAGVPVAQTQTRAKPLLVTPSAEQAQRSLATLRKLDDHPLYAMSYFGPAPRVDAGTEPAPAVQKVPVSEPTTSAHALRKPFACTVFVAAGDRPLFGRNFDWDHNPALVLTANPTDAYRSISVVDISYLGFTSAADVDDPAKREGLLRAVALPFDGMNEHGLTIGMAAVDDLRSQVRPGRAAVGSVGVMRQVLDHARTLDEAVGVLQSYNIDFDGGPGLHYLVADASGKSAAVEFVAGQVRVVPGRDSRQVMENFYLSDVTDRSGYHRYTTADTRLAATGGALTSAEAMALLATVAQGHTQWSAVYDLQALSVRLTTGKRYDTVHELTLGTS